jgi:hypothetical protein
VTMHRYVIDWPIANGQDKCRVSMLLEPEEMALAIKGGGVKATPIRLKICEEVRRIGSSRHPELRLQPVFFEQLTILVHPDSIPPH